MLIRSTAKVFVEKQQFVFETLWNKAIPARQRFRELEQGVKTEVIETIENPVATQERALELIKSAKEEILIIFSTSNAFRRQERAGAIDLLIRTAKSNDLNVRMMLPYDDYVINRIDKIRGESRDQNRDKKYRRAITDQSLSIDHRQGFIALRRIEKRFKRDID